MNIVQINGGAVGSTGKIMFGISAVCTDEKQETLCAAPEVSSGNKTGRNLYIIQNNNHRKRAPRKPEYPSSTIKTILRINSFLPTALSMQPKRRYHQV